MDEVGFEFLQGIEELGGRKAQAHLGIKGYRDTPAAPGAAEGPVRVKNSCFTLA
jgi:hypothetical protein